MSLPFPAAPVRAIAAALLLTIATVTPGNAQQKPILAPADYGRFESVGGDALSPDGKWYAYRLTKTEQDGELRIRRTDRDDPEQVIPLATAATFSRDSKYLVWTTDVSIKERERLTQQKKPIQLGLTIRSLASGTTKTFDAVRGFTFAPNGRYLSLQGYAPPEIRGKGAGLQIVDLTTGTVSVSFQDVGEYRWSDDGALLAMTIATGTPSGNAVQIYNPVTGTLRSLETSGSNYHAMTWRKGSTDLALFRSVAPAGTDKPGEQLLVWRSLAATPTTLTLDSTNTALGSAYELVDFALPRWSDDGKTIAIGLRPKAPKPDSSTKRAPGPPAPADETSTVQIWHAADVLVVPQQQSRLAGEARRTLLALWTLDGGKVVRLGADLSETASLLDGWHHAVEKTAAPYGWGTMFGRRYSDVWLIDANTGARTKAFEKVRYSYESTDGRYLLWFDGKDYISHEIASGKRVNLTAGMKTSFANTGSDSPTDVLPPYGVGGWLANDQAVLLYDQYDIWRVSPDGARRDKLTNGRAEQVVHRILRLTNDGNGIDGTKPIYLTLAGERDRQSGFGRLDPAGSVQRLLYANKAIRQLRKADSSDVFLYRSEDRATSPDVYATNAAFTAPKQLTHTNTFLKDFAWTHEELISFKSDGGIPLKGVLLYPANYDPSKKYPMIVYTYEILSNTLHDWVVPSERSYYNQTAWTLNGYFVLMPDIIFKPREPGISTVEAVRAAVRTVTDRGLVDPKRVGHVGHSWGGFEAAYLGTHGGDFLATTIAGAAITDLVSFMGQMHWNGGTPESDHSETGQARMQVPYWEDPAAHKRNSPIENVQNMTIPMLLAQGSKDGTVEFFQGTEFYNFARRAGKDVVLLVYEGEDHGFAKKANQIDYQRRILEWFGHYLKGEPAPKWITDGIKLSDAPAEIKRVADKNKADKNGPVSN